MKTNLVWYASYGSNIDEERFNCYIKGGKPLGSNKIYLGCGDKSLPKDSRTISIDHEMYFAKSSVSWDRGGVAFLKKDKDPKSKTLGKMYLITTDQFIEVLKQETNRRDIKVDFEEAMKSENYIVIENSWYGKIIYLGNHENIPVFTFTNEINLECNKPSTDYVKIIAKGIKKAYGLSSKELVKYFIGTGGIEGNYTLTELEDVFNLLD